MSIFFFLFGFGRHKLEKEEERGAADAKRSAASFSNRAFLSIKKLP